MPPSRPPHDPFTTSTSTSGLRTQPSQSSLRSTASSASTTTSRTRQNRPDTLFAPTLSRRPTSRTRAVEDEVLADSSSEQDRRRRQVRGRGSPAARHKKQQAIEEQDIVKRDAQGNYLLGGVDVGAKTKPVLTQEEDDEARVEELNAYYEVLARKWFTSGAGMTTRRVDENYESDRPDMMYCLKAEVIQKLENERWLYEPVDRLQPGIP